MENHSSKNQKQKPLQVADKKRASSGSERFQPAEVIQAIQKAKGIKAKAARLLKCSRPTLDKYAEKYPEIAECLSEEKENLGDEVEHALYEEAIMNRNITALIFLAKTKFKDRGYVERSEVTGARGKDLIADRYSKMTDQQLEEELQRLCSDLGVK